MRAFSKGMEMTDSKRIEKLTLALEAAANGQLPAFMPHESNDALGRLEQAAQKFFTRVQNISAESGQAMINLANADVRLLLWTEALHKINAADSRVHRGGNLNDFYRSIVLYAMEMTRAQAGAFGLFDEQGNLQEIIAEGFDAQTLAGDYLTALFNEHKSANETANAVAGDLPIEHTPLPILFSPPLVVENRLKGLIYLENKENIRYFESQKEAQIETFFTQEDAYMLSLFTDYLVRALDRTELVITLQGMINKLNNAQNQLLQSEKMASIGQLAAGVAHEINNPVGFVNSNLTTLTGYIDNLFSIIEAYEQVETAELDSPGWASVREIKHQLQLDFLREDVPDLLTESQEGLTRIKKIINDLKEFSYVHKVEWQYADIHRGLNSTINVVWNEIKYKAELIKNYGDLPEIKCLPPQLNQVFLNILVNAAQSIKTRGRITISTGTQGDRVWIAISDTGEGIPEQSLSRIFEPFFTSKSVGKGTGLGLSLSYSIVQKHHGSIDVSSKIGEGTTFTVVLPIEQPKDTQ